jgi:hypothetical protein
MNGAELHLLTNHLPVFGTLFGFLALLIGLMIKSEGALKVGFVFLIIAGITSVLVTNNGEEAEEIVEHMGLGEDINHFIHEHEEHAEGAMRFSIALGILSLLGFVFTHLKKPFAKITTYICLVFGLGMTIYFGIVAHSGGEIRHTEIREGFIEPSDSASETSSEMDND